jgi:hypothetical protein
MPWQKSRQYFRRCEAAPLATYLAPFHPVGPTLPPVGGRPFSIHHRTELWTAADLDRLAEFAAQVQFLTLATELFGAAVVDHLPLMPAVTLVEHRCCPFESDALAPFARMPNAGAQDGHGRRTCVQRGRNRVPPCTDEPVAGRPPGGSVGAGGGWPRTR